MAADDYTPRIRAVRALVWTGDVREVLDFIEGVEGLENVTFSLRHDERHKGSVLISGDAVRSNGALGMSMSTHMHPGAVLVLDAGELFVTTTEKFDALYRPLAEVAEPKHCNGCGNDDGPTWCEGVTG